MKNEINNWLFGMATSIAGPIILSYQNSGTKEKLFVFVVSMIALLLLNASNKIFIPLISERIKFNKIKDQNEYDALNRRHEEFVEKLCRIKIPQGIRYDLIVENKGIHPIDPDLKQCISENVFKYDRDFAFSKTITEEKAKEQLQMILNVINTNVLSNKNNVIDEIICHAKSSIQQTKRRQQLGVKLGLAFVYK